MPYEVRDILARFEALKKERAVPLSLADRVKEVVDPFEARMAPADGEVSATDYHAIRELLDVTAMESCQKLAHGIVSNITPIGDQWFSFDPPAGSEFEDDDEVKDWFAACTEIALHDLALSNYYLVADESTLNVCAYGTGAVFVGWDEVGSRPLFRSEIFGDFVFAEDPQKRIDTVFREFALSPLQAVQMFDGVPGAVLPEQVVQDAQDPKKCDAPQKYLHAVFPRVQRGEAGRFAMSYASLFVHVEKRHVIREGGFDENPYVVFRWSRWGRSPWGRSPAMVALPLCRQTNFQEAIGDFLAECTARPRLLVPSTFEGTADLRPGGVTVFNPAGGDSALPQAWLDTARGFQVNADLLELKKVEIRNIFFVPLFESLMEKSKQMTALEVSEIRKDKMSLFHPIFTRLASEKLQPELLRVFRLELEHGKFPPPPKSLLRDDGASFAIAIPDISFNSQVAQALKSLQVGSIQRVMGLAQPMMELRPDIIDNFDLDAIVRDAAHIGGCKAGWMLPADEVAEVRQARAAQQQAAQQAALQEQQAAAMRHEAGAIKDAGGVEGMQQLVNQAQG